MPIFLTGQRASLKNIAWMKTSQASPWRYAITSREDGNLSYKYGTKEVVERNRQQAFEALGVPVDRVLPLSLDVSYGVHWLDNRQQFHGLSNPGFASEGVWTTDLSTTLFLFVADCFPMGFFDRRTGSLGIFHAGRHELQAGLLQKFLDLGRDHEVTMSNLEIAIGPGICSAHYLFEQLPDEYHGSVVQDVEGKFHLDLRADIRSTLGKAGVSDQNIIEDQRCTYESPELFSHRRERGTNEGRFGFIVTRNG